MFARAIAAVVLFLFASPASAQGPAVPTGAPLDEAYRAQFAECDRHDRFAGVQFPIRNTSGKIVWYGCSGDPSRLSRLEKITARAKAPAAVIFASKLGHDEDGSRKACGAAKGPTDQCPTSLMLDASAETPCVLSDAGRKRCVPVDADVVPYAVIPSAAPKGIPSGRFKALTGVGVGDYGVVVANGRVVPVVVADEGPAYKIGEGSTALLSALSTSGRPRTISSGVVFILFPGTADPRSSLRPETFAAIVAKKGAGYYGRLVGGR